MDNRGLVAAVRANCMLATISLRNAPANADIPDVTRKAITSAMVASKDALYAATMDFEGRRLLPSVSFADINRDIGQHMLSYRQLLAGLDPNKQAMFSVALWFDPVPDPNGFGALPESVANKMATAVENRIVKAFDLGIEKHLENLNIALRLYVQRVGDYHAYMNGSQEGKRRVVLRDATVLSVHSHVITLQRLNISNSARLQRICDGLAEVLASSPDMLRKDALKRERCILHAKNSIGPEDNSLVNPPPPPAPLPETASEDGPDDDFDTEDGTVQDYDGAGEQVFDPTT